MIEPIAYRKKLEGKSNAHLIHFNDGRDYVVKLFQKKIEKTLPNEWISYCLARYLGLPIPFSRLVKIPQDFSSQIPGLEKISDTQHQFASLYVPDCSDGHQVIDIPKITNHRSLASIILFDFWLCNTDRTRKNILLHAEPENSYKLWTIDHAEVFGSCNWCLSDLENLSVYNIKSATHQIMAQFIEDEENFTEQLEIIQTIPTFLIEEIVAVIPDDWMISKEEKDALVSTMIMRRKKILPKLIKQFIKKTYRPLRKNH